MKNLAISFFFLLTSLVHIQAQLPNGSVAPNFTATDINGVSHNLYNLLNQGKTVYLDFSATWCSICWNYHNSNALKNLWNTYGPPGTNEAYVLFIESYEATNTNCLYGFSGCNNSTTGNWVAGTPYPIIDNSAIGELYQVSFYPNVFLICPSDKKLYSVGTQNMAGLWNARNNNCGFVPQATNTVTNVRCFGTSTGAIDLSVTGGTAPYTYNWSNGATTQDLVNIAAGTYTCTVTATNGTTSTTSPIAVTGPSTPLSIVQTGITAPFCNGILGSVTTTSSGGWGGYTYLWSNGQTTSAASNLSPGTYTVTVTDNNACSSTLTATIGAPVLPTATIAPPATITCAQSAVQLNGTGSSSGANFTYAWTAANGGNITGSTTNLITTANAAGTYTLVVTNTTTACTKTAVITVSADTAPPVAVAATPGTLNCNVSQLQLNGAGSTVGNNFTYNWTTTNGSIVSGQNTLAPLVNMAGTYQLLVTNTTNGCTANASTAVVQNQPVTANIASNTPVACFGGSNGAASVNAGGGTGIFTYLWSNGATTNAINGLSAGTYTATVTDNINCSATISLGISQPNALAPNASSTPQTAVGINNGTATAAPSGGTPGYTYAWSNGATGNTINNLAPGIYTVTISDIANCTAAQSVVVNAYSCAVSGTISVQNLLCANSGTGSATLTLTGGTAPFSYLWNTGATTAGLVNLAAGTYTVTATDAAGCVVTETASVTQAPPINVNATAIGQTVMGVNNGSASAAPSGGTPAYTYAWSTGATTAAIAGLAPGNYTVTITDNNGCTAAQTVVVTVFNCAITTQSNLVPASCANQSNGSIILTVVGGTPPFTYLWNTGATTQSLQNIPSGNYSVLIVDNAGCQITATYTVGVSDLSAPQMNCPGTIRVCPSDNIVQFNPPTVVDNCGSAGLQIVQTGGFPSGSPFPLGSTQQTFTATDASGNSATCTFEVIVMSPMVLDSAMVTPASNNQNNGAISVAISGGTAPYTYSWTNGSGQLISITKDIAGLAPGFYTVRVVDFWGCVFLHTVEVKQATSTHVVPVWVQDISLTPNPAKGLFTVTFQQLSDAPIQLSITNTTGQLMYEAILKRQLQTSVPCQSWPNGTYLVRLQSGEVQYATRIVVLH